MISNVFLTLTRSMASGSRILEIIDEEVDITDREAEAYDVKCGEIEFDHVYFRYRKMPGGCADRYFFDNFGRQYLWIIGQTGSAKSTLIQLIPRLYDATRGEVRIDGIPVRKYPMEHLRDAIAVVLQKNTLFSGTLLENLRWGKEDATMEEIKKACRIACADEFIDRLADGYETEMGQGGVNVSGARSKESVLQEPS